MFNHHDHSFAGPVTGFRSFYLHLPHTKKGHVFPSMAAGHSLFHLYSASTPPAFGVAFLFGVARHTRVHRRLERLTDRWFGVPLGCRKWFPWPNEPPVSEQIQVFTCKRRKPGSWSNQEPGFGRLPSSKPEFLDGVWGPWKEDFCDL